MVVLAQKKAWSPAKSFHTGSSKTGFVYVLGLSMDIVATHHAVLGISILPDLSTVRSCCNGLTVTLGRLRTLHAKEECVLVKPFRRVVRGSPAIC